MVPSILRRVTCNDGSVWHGMDEPARDAVPAMLLHDLPPLIERHRVQPPTQTPYVTQLGFRGVVGHKYITRDAELAGAVCKTLREVSGARGVHASLEIRARQTGDRVTRTADLKTPVWL